jgi:hypothetical protein
VAGPRVPQRDDSVAAGRTLRRYRLGGLIQENAQVAHDGTFSPHMAARILRNKKGDRRGVFRAVPLLSSAIFESRLKQPLPPRNPWRQELKITRGTRITGHTASVPEQYRMPGSAGLLNKTGSMTQIARTKDIG